MVESEDQSWGRINLDMYIEYFTRKLIIGECTAEEDKWHFYADGRQKIQYPAGSFKHLKLGRVPTCIC